MPLEGELVGSYTGNRSDPATAVREVTPNDSTDLPEGPCRAVICETAGTLDFHDHTGEVITGMPVAAGVVLPVGVRRVLTTSSAGTIWALY